VLVPVGGGGLSSGIVKGRDKLSVQCPIWGAEPLSANDAARSLRAGVICRAERESDTICDGARTLSLGQRNFAILRRGLAGIVEITEDAVARAVRLLFLHANLKAEPTGALAVAALLMDPARFAGQRVVCVVSGGNVDPELYASLILA
jgi:threonine dehydratase